MWNLRILYGGNVLPVVNSYFRDPPPKFLKSCLQGHSCLMKRGWAPSGSPVVHTLVVWEEDMLIKNVFVSCQKQMTGYSPDWPGQWHSRGQQHFEEESTVNPVQWQMRHNEKCSKWIRAFALEVAATLTISASCFGHSCTQFSDLKTAAYTHWVNFRMCDARVTNDKNWICILNTEKNEKKKRYKAV